MCHGIVVITLACLLVGTARAKQNRPPAGDTLVGINYFAGWWKKLPNKWHGAGWSVKDPDWRPAPHPIPGPTGL